MKIRLHELKSLVAQIINEGKFADELKELQQLYPNEARVFSSSPFVVNGQSTKWFKNWLVPRFLTKKVQKEFPIEHEVYSVRDYANNESAIKAAFTQPVFREALDAAFPPRFRLNNLDDPLRLTVHEMDGILEVFYEYKEKKDDLLGIDYDAIDIEGDNLGKIGPWNIWMPTTRETSCTIVRVRDPETGKMKASPCNWCTIRTKESNLFYTYTARHDEDIILYYIIKDNPEINNINNEDFISIGFKDGILDKSGITGGVTVSCNNDGLIEKDLKRIFGANYTSIINLLTQKTKEIGGQHPAKEKIKAATQNLANFDYLIKGLGREEQVEMAESILHFGQDTDNINPAVQNACYEYMSKSKYEHMLKDVAVDINCPPHVLKKLFNHNNDSINWKAFTNPNFPAIVEKDWEILSIHKNYDIRAWAAENLGCPPHILEKLFNGDDPDVSLKAFENPKFPKTIKNKNNFELLSNHEYDHAKEWVADNRQCPSQILKKLFNDDNDDINYVAFSNPNFPASIKNDNNLEFLSNHKSYKIRAWTARNPNCPPNILENLFNDHKGFVIVEAFENPSFPASIKNNFELLSNHRYYEIRQWAASHSNCPPEIVRKLTQDPEPEVSSAALRAMKKRKIQLESLRRKISKLIYAAG